MPTNYAEHFKPNATPQSEPAKAGQIKNAAGGFVFAVDAWTRLDRFLILGAEGGTYYANERSLSRDNAKSIVALIKENGERVVTRVTEISFAGRAYKNDAALFVLALCFAEGNDETKLAAREALPKIARIGTHLFNFFGYVDSMRGWGRGLTKSVAAWYAAKSVDDLAYEVTKYASRNGWSHCDGLRLSHQRGLDPKADPVRDWLYKYVVGKVKNFDGDGTDRELSPAENYIAACEYVKTATSAREIADYVSKYGLPREVLPTESLKSTVVWEALFEKMPITAMIRNAATMTRVGLIAPMSKAAGEFAKRVTDLERLKKGRIHPIQVLAALITYASGRSARGDNTWLPVQSVVDALDRAFYLAFDAVEPTGKRIMYAIDVSPSMSGGEICGVPNLSPRHGAAAMALVSASRETNYAMYGFSTQFEPLRISPRQRMDDAMREMERVGHSWTGTDASLPMLTAMDTGLAVDAFVLITDNETWAGKRMHPFEALNAYRKKSGIPAKLVVVGMTATGSTIGDRDDSGTLDVVGFDTDSPTIISDFIRE